MSILMALWAAIAAREAAGGALRGALAPLAATPAAQELVDTAAFVVAQLVTPSSPGGNYGLWAAVHTPEDPLSHWACFQ